MYVDKELLLSDAQAITTSALSTNIIDLGAARQVARGRQLYVVICIDQSFAGATSVEFRLMTHTTSTVSSGSIMVSTGAIAIANLTAGRAPIVLPIGDALNSAKRYMGLYYVVSGTATAGRVTAFIAVDAP